MNAQTPQQHQVDDAFTAHKPVKPYAGTSGRGGSDASHETKAREDADGTTTVRQRQALAYLDVAGALGLNTHQIGVLGNWHHGQASGVLSGLHKAGLIHRLAGTKRAGQSVYVHPDHLGGRATAQHGGKARAEETGATEHRLVLTEDEDALLVNLQKWVNARNDAQPILRLKRSSVEVLVGIIERASARTE